MRISDCSESRRPATVACSPRSWLARVRCAFSSARRACRASRRRRNLALQPLQRLGRGLKAQPCLSALRAQILQLVARLAHLGIAAAPPRAPGLPGSLRPAPCGCARCRPGSAGAWRGGGWLPVRRSAAKTSSAAVRASCWRASTCWRKARASPAAVSRKLCCCVRSSAMPLNCVRVCSSSAPAAAMRVSSSAHALGIAALPRRGPLQLDGRFVGAVLRLLALAVQLVAALGERVLAGLPAASISAAEALIRSVSAAISLLQPRLLRIHQRHAAGQHHAQPRRAARRAPRQSARPWPPAASGCSSAA